MQRPDGHYLQFWPEQAEHTVEYEIRVPSWDALTLQAMVFRTELLARSRRGLAIPAIGTELADRHSFGTIVSPFPPERFDHRNVFCFQYLPDILKIKEAAAATIQQVAQPHLTDATIKRFIEIERQLGRKPTLEEMDALFPHGVPAEVPLFGGPSMRVRKGEDPQRAYVDRIGELQDQVR